MAETIAQPRKSSHNHGKKETKTKKTNPIIGRIDRKFGHGAGRSTKKSIDEAADRYSFMVKMLGAPWMG